MTFIARTPIKTHKGDEKWPLFVNKQLFWWSTSITMHNNNEVLVDFKPFFSLNTLPHTSVGLTGCISIVFSVFNIFGSFDHYAAGYVPSNHNGNSLNIHSYSLCYAYDKEEVYAVY